MDMLYRGIRYNRHLSSLTPAPGSVKGRYRGLDWRFRHLQAPVTLQPNLDLLYRGVHRHTPDVATAAVAPVAADMVERSRSLMLNHHRAVRIRQQAMLQRTATEAGLKLESSSHWSRIQGKVYPDFWDSHDRNYAALS